MIDPVGQSFGNYRLVRLIGRGAFADVYLAEHRYLEITATIKILRVHLEQDAHAQFLHEARTIAHLQHLHIVHVLDFGFQDQTPYLVMEYASHGSLRTFHPPGSRLPLETIVSYVQQVASALQHAHDQGIIHRDVKPENLLLGERYTVLLSDFGLAMLTPHTQSLDTQAMTRSLVGTTPYLAPEQLQGKPRRASDQYALGVIVYEWLCGQRPFNGTPIEIATQHLSIPPPSLCERIPDLSPEIEQVVLRALAKEPTGRFASVQDFATALFDAVSPSLISPIHTPSAGEVLRPVSNTSKKLESSREEPSPPLQVATFPPGLTSSQGKQIQPIWKMPTFLTPLIGREQEVADVCTQLARPEVRLLTLLGIGGIGKTRLGAAVATQMRAAFADGVCFVGLASLSDSNLVMSTIASELGIQEQGQQSFMEQVKTALRKKHMLLLLDNIEQVLTAVPALEELLAVCPSLKILVTSRAVLCLQAERLYQVPPLALPDLVRLPEYENLTRYAAVAFFVERVQAQLPTFQLSQANSREIAAICVHLDGLPLALELAATRIRLLPPRALLARLSQRMALLTGGPRNHPERQQTLRNTLQWSYDLLSLQEQQLFRHLSIFVGGCTLEGAAAVMQAGNQRTYEVAGDFLDEVSSLLDKSLLYRVEQSDGEPRLLMLETVREFGLEALNEQQELETARTAHAAYYLQLSEEADVWLWGPQHPVWMQRLEQEHDNLRAALAWSLEPGLGEEPGQRTEIALRFGGALHRFWFTHGHGAEGVAFLERVLATSVGVTTMRRAKALVVAADMTEQGEAFAEEALVFYQEVGDQPGIGRALGLLGRFAGFKFEYVRAYSLLEESITLHKKLGNRWYLAWSLYTLAQQYALQGEHIKAQAYYEEALTIWRELGDKEVVAIALNRLAFLHYYLQDLVTARSMGEEALTLSRELGSKGGMSGSLNLLAEIALRQNDFATAYQFGEEVSSIEREVGSRDSETYRLHIFVRIETHLGNYDKARHLYEEILPIISELDNVATTADFLWEFASFVAAQGEVGQAAHLWGASEFLFESCGVPLSPVERVNYEQAVATARRHMDERAFAAAWAEGRTISAKEALANAEQVLAVLGRAALLPLTLQKQPPMTLTKQKPIYPAGLTAREVEVLRLVAQGLTYARVAEQLVITPRTVNFHLTSIYRKIQVTSRSAATRYAIEHQLV
jgi:predicted ATPase/serine/threonine protein kinase/DNA-binding CsgD family transcriptional regulator